MKGILATRESIFRTSLRKYGGPGRTAAQTKRKMGSAQILEEQINLCGASSDPGDKNGLRQREQGVHSGSHKTRLQQHVAVFQSRISVTRWSHDEHVHHKRCRDGRGHPVVVG